VFHSVKCARTPNGIRLLCVVLILIAPKMRFSTSLIACSLINLVMAFNRMGNPGKIRTSWVAASENDKPINGETNPLEIPAEIMSKLENMQKVPLKSSKEVLPLAPQLTYDKFLTMQNKRVVVTVRYSAGAGLRPYFLTLAKKLKTSHPDVFVQRQPLPQVSSETGEATFEVLVDNKVVVGNSRSSKQKTDTIQARSVFISMQELDVAIARSRRKRRPQTTYGDDEREPLRKS